MSHAIHELPRRVFGDDCEECIGRATSGLDGLMALDLTNLTALFMLAAEVVELKEKPDDASHADMKAVETIRTAATIFNRAGANVVDIRWLSDR